MQQASAFGIVSHFILALLNTLAFYITELIMAVKSFMIQAPGQFNGEKYLPHESMIVRTARMKLLFCPNFCPSRSTILRMRGHTIYSNTKYSGSCWLSCRFAAVVCSCRLAAVVYIDIAAAVGAAIEATVYGAVAAVACELLH